MLLLGKLTLIIKQVLVNVKLQDVTRFTIQQLVVHEEREHRSLLEKEERRQTRKVKNKKKGLEKVVVNFIE